MVRYKMLARDLNSSPVQYRTWMVNDIPDFTGQFYFGDKSGSNPLIDISAYAIFNPGEVVDFNLPNPLDWGTTHKTLPSYICDAQLAVLDGYIYLFGGQNSNKIFRASTNNPADWTDTGSTLPISGLAGSQLAVLDGYLYLFGGTTDATFTSATDVILSAPTSNPLNWTSHGSLLPKKIHHSQLAVIGNNIYLFGGNENNGASNAILTAPLSNPLSWSNTGFILPDAIYGSQLSIIDGYVFLLGGLLSNDIPTANIYSALISQPLVWNVTGFLPHPSYYGQFATIGSRGYLFTPTVSAGATYTKILRCNLNAPNQWVDTQATVMGSASQSHLAIVYDRIWLYGGNGSTVILANNSILKYNLGDVALFQYYRDALSPFDYGNITRTQVQQTPSELALFQILGFAPWRTDYGSFNF
jgi:N-acetylneuraminic acid mutarotase